MRALELFERHWGDAARVVLDRSRAMWWRGRGARLGDRTRVGANCVAERPWALSAGERVQIEHGVHIKAVDDAAKLQLGAYTFIGFGSEIDVAQAVTIGAHVLIAPGCFITDHSHRHAWGALLDTQGNECAPVTIADDVWLGAHSVVLPGVSIGHGAIVGAGAVVTRNVEAGAIMAGVPARRIGDRRNRT